jgi:hypothetical protein
MVNGNRRLAADLAAYPKRLESRDGCVTVRIWHIPVADKAHALNSFLREIPPDTSTAFFVDGYVRVMPEAFRLMHETMEANSDVFAVSGVPTVGTSAPLLRRRMLEEGGIHGNLFAVRGDVCRRLRESGFKLPLGIYWTDGLMGAVFCFSLDPSVNQWNSTRIIVDPRATWLRKPAVWWRWTDVRAYFKRLARQAQGKIENQAIRDYLARQRKRPESLPQTSSELVEHWMAEHPREARRLFIRNPLCLWGLRRIRTPRDWSRSGDGPELMACT